MKIEIKNFTTIPPGHPGEDSSWEADILFWEELSCDEEQVIVAHSMADADANTITTRFPNYGDYDATWPARISEVESAMAVSFLRALSILRTEGMI